MSDPLVDKQIDGYRVEEVLGQGGMGVVYKAEDANLSRTVALKRIAPALAKDEEFLQRFCSEARALARIDSPYIVRVHALRRTEVGMLIVMEYVNGGNLKDRIRTGPMGWQEALPLIKQMAKALEHAHGAEVIHRDVKPHNIMLTTDGTVKVTDFGLAKMHRPDSDQTVTQGVYGTLNYMSPEQVQGVGDLDHRSDIYSLGMTIYEMLAGELPFNEDSNEFEQMRTIVEEELPPPDELGPDLPDELSSLVMKTLEKDPADRFQSAKEMRENVETFENEYGTSQEKRSTSAPEEAILEQVNGWKIAGYVAAFVLLALVGGYWLSGGEEPDWVSQTLLGLTGSGSAPPTEDESVAPDRSVLDRSIAVLPFQNLGGEESKQFTRGIHDGLLTRLSNVSDLEVISRTSVMRFQNASQGVPEIATDLGAKWIVEGAVQKAGQQVLVNAQLIDGETDTHQWAEDYRRKLTTENLFDIQTELTKKISRSLRAELTTSEERRVADRPTDDLDAFQLYTQGRGLLKQRTQTAMRRSIDYFQRAIEQDSTHAPAWAGLADATALLQNYGYERPESVPPPDSSARRALSLNPALAEAHTALSMTYQRQGDGPAALQAVNRAVELNPSYSLAYNQRGWLLLMLGKPEPAHSSAQKSVRLDPLSAEARSQLFNTNLALGNPEAALQAAQKTREVNEDEDYKTGRLYEGLALYHLERYEDAQEVLTSLSVPWTGAGAEVTLLLTHVKQGHDAEAEALFSEVRRSGDRFAIGLAHAALGRTEEAFAAFESIEEWGYWPTLALRYYFPDVLGPLREQPRFESLLRRVNQQRSLNPDGSLPSSVLLSTDPAEALRIGGDEGYSAIAPSATASIPSSSKRMVVQSSSGSAPRSS